VNEGGLLYLFNSIKPSCSSFTSWLIIYYFYHEVNEGGLLYLFNSTKPSCSSFTSWFIIYYVYHEGTEVNEGIFNLLSHTSF